MLKIILKSAFSIFTLNGNKGAGMVGLSISMRVVAAIIIAGLLKFYALPFLEYHFPSIILSQTAPDSYFIVCGAAFAFLPRTLSNISWRLCTWTLKAGYSAGNTTLTTLHKYLKK